MPGLLSFHMGAFVSAAEAGVPLVPVTIRGSRSLLRAGSLFPRRSRIHIIVSSPILPQGSDWAAAVKLRDAGRAALLSHLGEPDLAQEKSPV
jgi:1-acyl-sn-glycerol-3-phosphate acyltransferase